MTNEELNEALNHLADILGGSTGTTTTGQPTGQPSGQPIGQPSGQPKPSGDFLSLQQRTQIATDVMYLMSVPIMTPAKAREFEDSIPSLIEWLKILKGKPATKRALAQSIKAVVDKSEVDDPEARELVELIKSDLVIQDERFALPPVKVVVPIAIAAVGAATAVFKLGYDIGKDFAKNTCVLPMEALGERYIPPSLFPSPLNPSPQPFPYILCASGEPSIEGSSQISAISNLKILKTLYLRPDIRSAVIQSNQTFIDLLSRDKEAAEIFNEISGIKKDERIGPAGAVVAVLLVAGGIFITGLVVGYLVNKC